MKFGEKLRVVGNLRGKLLTTSVLVGGALLAVVGAPASAQDAAAETEASSVEASEGEGDVIMVTARRREESLQETPIAISAFSAETLEQRQIVQTQDLERITPS